MTTPFDDNDMKFDKTVHRYVLTDTCVAKELNVNLSALLQTWGSNNAADVPNAFLKRVSMLVYNYIYKHTCQKDFVEYCLAKDERLRDTIKRAMLERVFYLLTNGDIGGQAGVNLKDGRSMQSQDLRGEMRVSPDEHDILLNAGLLFTGYRNVPVSIKLREDY